MIFCSLIFRQLFNTLLLDTYYTLQKIDKASLFPLSSMVCRLALSVPSTSTPYLGLLIGRHTSCRGRHTLLYYQGIVKYEPNPMCASYHHALHLSGDSKGFLCWCCVLKICHHEGFAGSLYQKSLLFCQYYITATANLPLLLF